MTDIPFLDISSIIGLIATGVLTFNLLLGMLLGTAYKKSFYWKRLPVFFKKIKISDLHNWTAYIALSLVLTHPLLLLFDPATRFTFFDIIFPVNAPHQKIYVAFGVIAMYAVITVIITTQKQIRKKIGYRIWKNIHLISFGTAVLFIVHGILMDPLLKDRPVDIFDTEKLVSEICLVVLIITVIMRIKYHLSKTKGK